MFVRPACSYHEHLLSLNQRYAEAGKPPARILEVSNLLSDEDVLELVNAGIMDLTVTDAHVAKLWSRVLPDIRVHDDLKVNERGRIAWMVRKDNPLLRNSLDEFIQKHRQGSLIGNVLFTRYFENEQWIRNPLHREQMETLSSLAPVFKKYAERYGLDWRLVAAQAFQESWFDHSRRSHAGAVGIMQVLPSTGSDHRIRIPDVYDLESNIHAAVKSLALLRDEYFSEPDLDPETRIRLALAAYNAGPRKIARARAKTEQLGYDPNRWFQNTEYGTLPTVGREPVRYVSNINKYYVAYVMSDEILRLREETRNHLLSATR